VTSPAWWRCSQAGPGCGGSPSAASAAAPSAPPGGAELTGPTASNAVRSEVEKAQRARPGPVARKAPPSRPPSRGTPRSATSTRAPPGGAKVAAAGASAQAPHGRPAATVYVRKVPAPRDEDRAGALNVAPSLLAVTCTTPGTACGGA